MHKIQAKRADPLQSANGEQFLECWKCFIGIFAGFVIVLNSLYLEYSVGLALSPIHCEWFYLQAINIFSVLMK